MKPRLLSCNGLLALSLSAAIGAQEIPRPGPEHQKLAGWAGTWDAVIENTGMENSKGTEERKAFGGFWLTIDFAGTCGGMALHGHGVLGFDTMKKKYVQTWADSGSPLLTHFEGDFDNHGKVLTMTGAIPAMDGTGTMVTMRSVTTCKDDNTQVCDMFGPGIDGKEMKLGTITYTRRGGNVKPTINDSGVDAFSITSIHPAAKLLDAQLVQGVKVKLEMKERDGTIAVKGTGEVWQMGNDAVNGSIMLARGNQPIHKEDRIAWRAIRGRATFECKSGDVTRLVTPSDEDRLYYEYDQGRANPVVPNGVGSVYTFSGVIDGVFADVILTGDPADPLQFELTIDRGLVYRAGRGTVSIKGKTVTLPIQ